MDHLLGSAQFSLTQSNARRRNGPPLFGWVDTGIMAPHHHRTGSNEGLLTGPQAVPRDVGESSTQAHGIGLPPALDEEPELLEIYHKTGGDLPVILSIDDPLSVQDLRQSASTVTVSPAQQQRALDDSPKQLDFHASAFDKRLPKFLCCGCLCCVLSFLLIVMLARVAAGEESLEDFMPTAHAPPSPPLLPLLPAK